MADYISIRAPARGATSPETVRHHDTLISIRAPARGATRMNFPEFSYLLNFNPRSREGSDYDDIYKILGINISIRAPARGATTGIFATKN